MITGDVGVLDDAINLTILDVAFETKPLVIGGLAMAYYGLRKTGADIDFIVTDRDYQALAKRYPKNKMDRWGDMGVSVGSYELLRSIFRLDYAFFSQGAIEFEKYKVLSFEKLLFMKALAFWNQPEIPKHVGDFHLAMQHYLGVFQNGEFAENAMKYVASYQAAPDGIVLGDHY